MKYTTTLISILFLTSHLHAQDSKLIENCNLLTIVDKKALMEMPQNVNDSIYKIALRYVKAGDSINSSINALKLDPYYIDFLSIEDDDTSYLNNKLLLTQTARKEIADRIAKLRLNQSEVYSQFKEMYKRDQKLRNSYDKCADSFSCAFFRKKIFVADSIHFDYLNKFIQKNEWPAVENGSYFATILAIHNHSLHNYYIPKFAHAVIKGYGDIGALLLMLYWQENATSRKKLEHRLKNHEHMRFDISSLLNFQMPSSLNRIQNIISKKCPVSIHIAFETNSEKAFDGWINLTQAKSEGDPERHIVTQFINNLHPFCPDRIPQSVWEISNQPSTEKDIKLILYIFQFTN